MKESLIPLKNIDYGLFTFTIYRSFNLLDSYVLLYGFLDDLLIFMLLNLRIH